MKITKPRRSIRAEEAAARRNTIQRTRKGALGRRAPAASQGTKHTGRDDCKCAQCSISMNPRKRAARLQRHRKRTVLKQPMPRRRRKKIMPQQSVVVDTFTALQKGQKVWLRATEHYERELAIVLGLPVTGDDVICVEVQRTGSGWIPTRKGYAMLEVKASQIEGYNPVSTASVGVKGKRAQEKARRDLSVYQVYRDANGIAYLRVNVTSKGAQFIVNKGFSVELVELDANSTFGHMLAMRPVVGADIQECAKRLLHPLNDNVTISTRAKEEIEKILNNKELQMKATQAVPAAPRPGKFSQITAPAARNTGNKAVASAKTARNNAAPAAPAPRGKAVSPTADKPTRKTAASGNGSSNFGANNNALTIHSLVKGANPLREGTFCHAQVAAIMANNGKNVAQAQAHLDKSGCNPNGRRLEVSWLAKKGFATFK